MPLQCYYETSGFEDLCIEVKITLLVPSLLIRALPIHPPIKALDVLFSATSIRRSVRPHSLLGGAFLVCPLLPPRLPDYVHVRME